MKMRKLALGLLLVSLCAVTTAGWAQEIPDEVEGSPKAPWGEFQLSKEAKPFSWTNVWLWLPNRLMDFFDIFRVDIGIGPAHGAVLRLSKYAQLGYRDMTPTSLRIGDFGRNPPYLSESSPEYGISPFYVESKERAVCPGEIGAGVDVLIAGAYVGICLDEVADFAAGLFFFDIKSDDLR
jgi:hypothetical protein